jgi:hypothetical protein
LFRRHHHGSWRTLRRHNTVIQSSDDKKEETKKKTKKKKQVDYEQRRQQWMERYGSLEALQSTFGSNIHQGGDLTPEQTRRLYHALLPRALLGLYEGEVMNPEELAPLAFQARIAAKQYARSRSVWYARVATMLVDQYRKLRTKFTSTATASASMTWEEIWSKYEAQIVREECVEELLTSSSSSSEDYDDDTKKQNDKKKSKEQKFHEKDLTMRIYLRILEKSCATNQAFDAMFLTNTTTTATTNNNNTEVDVLSQMGQQLEQDVRDILLGPKESAKISQKVAKRDHEKNKQQIKEEYESQKIALKHQKKQIKMERKRLEDLEDQRYELEKISLQEKRETQLEADKKRRKEQEKQRKTQDFGLDVIGEEEEEEEEESNDVPLPSPSKSQSNREVLKILAGTRRTFRRILKELN